jgi:hypothetical protein
MISPMSLFDGVVNDRRRSEVLATGARAQATVTGVRSLGKASAAGYLTEISLQIDPPGGKPVSRTIKEWLPPGTEAHLTIGSAVPVRYEGKTVVLEATPGAAGALGQQSQTTWMPPPAQPSGSYLPPPGQPAPTYGMPNVQIDGLNLGELVNQALQSGNYTVSHVGVDGVHDVPRLLATGARATATVIDVTDMGLGTMTVSLVELRVEPPGEPPFETMTNVRFSTPERRAMVSPGARVPVRYDPADHTKVALDAPAMGIG